MKHSLSKTEKERLMKAVASVLAIPFIDDIEDYIWEAVFSYTKKLSVIDPLLSIRSKRLFDIVDDKKKIGWSAKAVQWPIKIPGTLELVIQRADIFKKAKMLGFPHLSIRTDPQILGRALMKHWINEKVAKDAAHQGVKDKRVCILVKSRKRDKFVYIEEDLAVYSPNDLMWKWTDGTRTGLQGFRKKDGYLVYRWYPNQKQLFERFEIPISAFTFELSPQRIGIGEIVDLLFDQPGKS